MKTIYTLLFAFGLFFTSHAQQSLHVLPLNGSESNLNSSDLEEFNQITFGNSHSLIINETVTAVFENEGVIRKISIESMNNLSIVNLSNFELSNVKVFEIYYNEGDIINIPTGVLNALPNLKYIYLKSYHTLTDGIINNVLQDTMYQLSNVKVVYQILENS